MRALVVGCNRREKMEKNGEKMESKLVNLRMTYQGKGKECDRHGLRQVQALAIKGSENEPDK